MLTVKGGLHFSQSILILRYDVKAPSVEAAELQGRGSTVGQHLPRGDEGLEVRIINTSATGYDTSDIGDDTPNIGES